MNDMTDRDRKIDFESKLRSLRSLIEFKGYKGLWISTVVNFAWLTGGGRAFVNLADDNATGKILVTPTNAWLVATNNEVPRLQAEELEAFGLQAITYPWYVTLEQSLLQSHGIEMPLVSDRELEPEIAILRSQLTGREVDLIKRLGKDSARVVEACCKDIQPGEKECEIAGRISKGFWQAGMEPLVLNIAADDRAYSFRHPIPTGNPLEKHLAISVCVKKWGLNVTFTRIVHFGSLPDVLANKHAAAVRIEAQAIASSIPGADVNSIFNEMLQVYQETGFPDEWKLHPIGGLIGYQPREFNVAPDTHYNLQPNQAFCWNPTIAGTKSEDTLVITAGKPEIITSTDEYPFLEVLMKDQLIRRPNILVR